MSTKEKVICKNCQNCKWATIKKYYYCIYVGKLSNIQNLRLCDAFKARL